MILYIDTTDYSGVSFAASDGKKIRKAKYKIDSHRSYETLGKLEAFLRRVKGSGAVEKIVANKGPGSYTGVRVGVAIAKSLGFAWNIPIKFLSADKFKIK